MTAHFIFVSFLVAYSGDSEEHHLTYHVCVMVPILFSFLYRRQIDRQFGEMKTVSLEHCDFHHLKQTRG